MKRRQFLTGTAVALSTCATPVVAQERTVGIVAICPICHTDVPYKDTTITVGSSVLQACTRCGTARVWPPLMGSSPKGI